ncbi:MAG: S9 family peptidase [Chitinophagaceae bacterium]|nr:S9 family peptidase [Chitinophagaceae bacterium]
MEAQTVKKEVKEYLPAKRGTVSDNYFGTTVTDPYRWLEDENSEETKAWVEEQNEKTAAFLSEIGSVKRVHNELKNMWNFEKYGNPFKEGKYYFFYKNDGLQNQSVLYVQEGLNGTPKVFLDPNKLNEKGTSALGSFEVSKNQKYAAYAVSDAGSDWQDIYVKEIETGKKLDDHIEYSKFSGVSWSGDDGFYYSGYDKPSNESQKFSAKTEFQKIFYHQIGTPQSKDRLVYEDKQHPLRYKGAGLSEDERFLILSLSEGTDGSELQFMDLKDGKQKQFKMLAPGFDHNHEFVDVVNGKLILYTNLNASNYRLVIVDPSNPDTKNWKNFVGEKSDKLEGISRVGDKFFCTYLHNASSKIDVYNLKGEFEQSIELPGIGTAAGFGGSAKDDHTFYTFSSFNKAPTIYKYDLNTNQSTLFKKPNVRIDLDSTVVEQRWYTSKDGTKVPMFLYYKKGTDLSNGDNPVFLYGYGGFNISLTPSFSVPMSYFVQQGGIYVLANIRGGSEFGENWHKAGMLEKKQNVFDDFISAAEFLIKEKITNKNKIAIHGRSNGGLLVGACMTQRPDLFKVCLPGVGVLDMLRYHKFTVGWGWAVEYGSSDKAEDFKYLYKYSPLHTIRKGTGYPATMITTADHDDRVVPAHSYKFAATLQSLNASNEPILIRIDTQAGHGAGKPTSKQIEEWADVMSFTMHHLKMR